MEEFNEFLFDSLLYRVNYCIQNILLYEWDDDAVIDFHCGCTLDEKKMLQKVIETVSQANEDISMKNIYIAVLYYYYLCIVIEYYATEIFDLYDITSYVKGTNRRVIQTLVKRITLSDEPWASYTRRTVNNLD
jgi:hypothetical protein